MREAPYNPPEGDEDEKMGVKKGEAPYNPPEGDEDGEKGK